jgi:hypothetical protein
MRIHVVRIEGGCFIRVLGIHGVKHDVTWCTGLYQVLYWTGLDWTVRGRVLLQGPSVDEGHRRSARAARLERDLGVKL